MTTNTISERGTLVNQVQERFTRAEVGLWQRVAANAAEIKKREAPKPQGEESCPVLALAK